MKYNHPAIFLTSEITNSIPDGESNITLLKAHSLLLLYRAKWEDR